MKLTGRGCPVTNIEDFEEEVNKVKIEILDKLKELTVGFNQQEKGEIYHKIAVDLYSKVQNQTIRIIKD